MRQNSSDHLFMTALLPLIDDHFFFPFSGCEYKKAPDSKQPERPAQNSWTPFKIYLPGKTWLATFSHVSLSLKREVEGYSQELWWPALVPMVWNRGKLTTSIYGISRLPKSTYYWIIFYELQNYPGSVLLSRKFFVFWFF